MLLRGAETHCPSASQSRQGTMWTRVHLQELTALCNVSSGHRSVQASLGSMQVLMASFLFFYLFFHVWDHTSAKETITTADCQDTRCGSWSTWHNNREAKYGKAITYFCEQQDDQQSPVRGLWPYQLWVWGRFCRLARSTSDSRIASVISWLPWAGSLWQQHERVTSRGVACMWWC